MSHAKIQTELDNLAYTPRETIRGAVTWQTSERPAEAALRLIYYTSGKGTQDVVVVAEQAFDAPSESDHRAFEFLLPESPWSFSGKLVSLIWALELEVLHGKEALVERLDFNCTPTGTEIQLHAHAHESMPAYGNLGFGGSKRRKNSASA
ncbi:MAG: hypothetical protein KDM64_17960 [Verrucomicrobiae bacterium]|nr:hypothetical protein [Verrucomicrobiae bacterium]